MYVCMYVLSHEIALAGLEIRTNLQAMHEQNSE